MFKKSLILAVIVAIWSLNCYADVINSSWVGGENGMWGNAANWDPAIVPDNNGTDTFNVTIAGEYSNGICIGLTQSHTINRMDCNVINENLDFDKWTSDWIELTMVDPNGLTNYGSLDIGRLNISGTITNVAGAYCCLQDMEIRGNIYNQANAKLELEGDVQLEGDFNLENDLNTLKKAYTSVLSTIAPA